MSGAKGNEKGVKGWGQLRGMAYISHSLFNESSIDPAITPQTHAHTQTHTHTHECKACTRDPSTEQGLLDLMASPKSNCPKLHLKKKKKKDIKV